MGDCQRRNSFIQSNAKMLTFIVCLTILVLGSWTCSACTIQMYVDRARALLGAAIIIITYNIDEVRKSPVNEMNQMQMLISDNESVHSTCGKLI